MTTSASNRRPRQRRLLLSFFVCVVDAFCAVGDEISLQSLLSSHSDGTTDIVIKREKLRHYARLLGISERIPSESTSIDDSNANERSGRRQRAESHNDDQQVHLVNAILEYRRRKYQHVVLLIVQVVVHRCRSGGRRVAAARPLPACWLLLLLLPSQ